MPTLDDDAMGAPLESLNDAFYSDQKKQTEQGRDLAFRV